MILVGRTGLEATLRLIPEIELLRAPAPVRALGELTHPIDGDSPMRATVIAAWGAVPPGRVRTFVAAARRLSPGVRVLIATAFGLARSSEHQRAVSEFDGVLEPGLTAGELRALLLAEAPAAPVMPVGARPTVSTTPEVRPPAVALTSPESPRGQDSQPDAGLASAAIRAMLHGGGVSTVAAAALSELRARLGGVEIELLSEQPAAPGPCVAPVVHGGKILGYLCSPVVDASRLEREASSLALICALARQHEQLRRAAFSDELTGAWNRRYFRRFLEQAIEQARRERRHIVVMVFDIDNFKHYNDRYGHAAGDEILTETVRLMSSVIRPSDRVCRIGGDEFAVVFTDAPVSRPPLTKPGPAGDTAGPPRRLPDDIMQIARRFQRQIAEHRFPKLSDEAPGRLTISGGLSVYPWDGRSVDELLAFADALALQAKRAGKNALVFGPEG